MLNKTFSLCLLVFLIMNICEINAQPANIYEDLGTDLKTVSYLFFSKIKINEAKHLLDSLSEKETSTKEKFYQNIFRAFICLEQNQTDSAKIFLKKANQLSADSENKLFTAIDSGTSGIIAYRENNFIRALHLLKVAKQQLTDIEMDYNVKIWKAYFLLYEGRSLAELGFYYDALENYEEAKNIFLNCKLLGFSFVCQRFMGRAYLMLLDEDKDNKKSALENLLSSLKGFKELNLDEELTYTYIQLTDFHIINGSLDTAWIYLDSGYQIAKKYDNCFMARGITENNRGEILMKRELYKQAIDKFITAISIYDSTTYFNSKVKAYINLSQAYFFDKSYNEALTTALIALNIADSLKLGKRKVEASLQLSQIYKALGNYEVAFQYLSTANLISDSLNISDNAEKAIVTREILGAEKIKSDNIRLIYENENRFKLTLITIISLVSFFIISLLLLTFSSKKKKQKFEVEAQRELIQRQESFRTKIAQELHDSIGSDILGVKLFAETIFKTKNIDDMFLKSGLDEISNIVSKVRNISHEIVSPVLFNKKTLHAAISEHIDNFQNKINMQLHLSVSQNIVWEDIDENTQHEYFRVTQEILKNAINHSEAKNINISLTVIDNFLELTITDDGKGFEYNQMKMNGIGLKNIQSRALTMKAKLTVNTSVGKGCSIKLKSAV